MTVSLTHFETQALEKLVLMKFRILSHQCQLDTFPNLSIYILSGKNKEKDKKTPTSKSPCFRASSWIARSSFWPSFGWKSPNLERKFRSRISYLSCARRKTSLAPCLSIFWGEAHASLAKWRAHKLLIGERTPTNTCASKGVSLIAAWVPFNFNY